MEKGREKLIRQDLKKIMADIEKNKKLKKKKGMEFYSLNEFEIIEALIHSRSPINSWYGYYTYRTPGSTGYMEMNLFESSSGNVSSSSRTTLFFGSSVFVDDPGTALNARCRSWPLMTSDSIYLTPGDSEVLRFDFPVPQDAVPGNIYLGHFLSWKAYLNSTGISEIYFRKYFPQKIQ